MFGSSCPHCKLPYDEKKRKPLLLPCGHASCRNCLSEMEDRDEIRCGEKKCRKSCTDNVSDLPMVYALIPASSGASGQGSSGRTGRDVIPLECSSSMAPIPTGREVVPMDMDDTESLAGSSVSAGNSASSAHPTCGVCMDDYCDANPPRLLTCGHTFCTLCLQDLEKKDNYACPQCRKTRNKGSVPKLPVVQTLIHTKNAKNKVSSRISTAQVMNRAQELQQEHTRRMAASIDSDPKNMELFVQDIRGQTHTFRVNPNAETVLQLRQRLPGRPDDCRYLTFEGRTLENQRYLAEYNVRPQCTIHERGRLSGGEF